MLVLFLFAALAVAGSSDWTAVWSVWSNCDCSGPSNSEHIVPVCAATGVVAEQPVQVECSADGTSVTVRSFKGSTCGPGAFSNSSHPVDQCLPVPVPNGYVRMMNKFQCLKSYEPRKGSIVGKQYEGTACGASDGGPVIAEANYVSGCFPSCKPPSTSNPFPNLSQIADGTSLTGAYCNGTTCGSPCVPDGRVTVGECQVLGHRTQRRTSIKYAYWQGP